MLSWGLPCHGLRRARALGMRRGASWRVEGACTQPPNTGTPADPAAELQDDVLRPSVSDEPAGEEE
jgi:hypothetical protein